MTRTIEESFSLLRTYCEEENFKGWDPYDGLTSNFFQSLPFFKTNRLTRLSWIQFFKRSPVNFRSFLGVHKKENAKGIALFLSGYCLLYKIYPEEEVLKKINDLTERLLLLQNHNYSGSCWGYYFDWQARAFFQPAETPTVVATSFSADALMNAYEVTGNTSALKTAISSADFVLKDLNRTYDNNGNFSFSYSPIDHTQVHNASLLGARLLSRVFHYTSNSILKEEACKAVKFACNYQQPDGAWAYGTLPFHSWIDNFHTGFNLECIYEYGKYTGAATFTENVEKGFSYYIGNFFCKDGASKYYHNKLFPVDIHSPAQLIATISKLDRFSKYQPMAETVLRWTIENMQDPKGYFYYQKKKYFSSKIPYMRWAQAWMFYAMSYFLAGATKNQIHEQTDYHIRNSSV